MNTQPNKIMTYSNRYEMVSGVNNSNYSDLVSESKTGFKQMHNFTLVSREGLDYIDDVQIHYRRFMQMNIFTLSIKIRTAYTLAIIRSEMHLLNRGILKIPFPEILGNYCNGLICSHIRTKSSKFHDDQHIIIARSVLSYIICIDILDIFTSYITIFEPQEQVSMHCIQEKYVNVRPTEQKGFSKIMPFTYYRTICLFIQPETPYILINTQIIMSHLLANRSIVESIYIDIKNNNSPVYSYIDAIDFIEFISLDNVIAGNAKDFLDLENIMANLSIPQKPIYSILFQTPIELSAYNQPTLRLSIKPEFQNQTLSINIIIKTQNQVCYSVGNVPNIL
jgi:hypothetical protein